MSFLPLDQSPKEITIETYWKPGNGVWYLREALGEDHEENLWNWFKRTYPDLNPVFYEIKDPKTLLTEEISEEFENHTREELIQEIMRLRKIVDRFC
jgi:hypothetical protein